MGYKVIEPRGGGGSSKSWRFEVDGDLRGEYLSSRPAKSKAGKPLTFHHLMVDGEEVSILGGTVLNGFFSEHVKPGVRVEIKFVGEKPGKNGNYKDYQCGVWDDNAV